MPDILKELEKIDATRATLELEGSAMSSLLAEFDEARAALELERSAMSSLQAAFKDAARGAGNRRANLREELRFLFQQVDRLHSISRGMRHACNTQASSAVSIEETEQVKALLDQVDYFFGAVVSACMAVDEDMMFVELAETSQQSEGDQEQGGDNRNPNTSA